MESFQQLDNFSKGLTKRCLCFKWSFFKWKTYLACFVSLWQVVRIRIYKTLNTNFHFRGKASTVLEHWNCFLKLLEFVQTRALWTRPCCKALVHENVSKIQCHRSSRVHPDKHQFHSKARGAVCQALSNIRWTTCLENDLVSCSSNHFNLTALFEQ